jgi:hypothetical protein
MTAALPRRRCVSQADVFTVGNRPMTDVPRGRSAGPRMGYTSAGRAGGLGCDHVGVRPPRRSVVGVSPKPTVLPSASVR